MKKTFPWLIPGSVGLVLVLGGIVLALFTPNLEIGGGKVSASVPSEQAKVASPRLGFPPLYFPFISKKVDPTATPTHTPTHTPTKFTNFTPTHTLTRLAGASATITHTPTRTSTHTATSAVGATPTPTPTRTPTPTSKPPSGGGAAVFGLGAGGADVIPHQIVRTADDRVYVFAYKGDGQAQLNAYWTSAAGLPTSGANFNASFQLTNSSNILSVDPIYDGGHIIHVLINDLGGNVKDYPFDTTTNTYKAVKTLDTSGGSVVGYYVGTSGLSGMFDANGKLHLAFWSNSNHIIYRSYTYNSTTDALSLVDGPTQLDSAGNANHPALAVSALDGSVTVAWVSEATTPARILAKTRTSAGWGAVETVSSAAVWTSTSSGINIDQGPSLMIGSDGKRHLVYIENWAQTSIGYQYGKVHYAVNSGSGWTDQDTGFYTHDPALAINGAGQVFVIGHGFELNQVCTSMDDMCAYPRDGSGTWGTPTILIAHNVGQSFDSSPSVKWSAVGFNRPGTIEFIFAEVGAGYANSTLYYGRLN